MIRIRGGPVAFFAWATIYLLWRNPMGWALGWSDYIMVGGAAFVSLFVGIAVYINKRLDGGSDVMFTLGEKPAAKSGELTLIEKEKKKP